MQDLTLSLVQTELFWHDIDANLSMLEEKIATLGQETDVIILPEMFSTGFTMEARDMAEPSRGKTLQWMKRMSSQSHALIIGSFIVNENGKYYNRLHCVMHDDVRTYDKRHLFRMADEHHYFDYGKTRLIVNRNVWRILPLVCYDLRFPVWSRNRTIEDRPEYDLAVYIANWPASRISAWDVLLKARAVENLAYCAGVNRTGFDGNHIEYNGHSGCYGPKGESHLYADDQSGVFSVTLSYDSLLDYRKKFPAFLDSDRYVIE